MARGEQHVRLGSRLTPARVHGFRDDRGARRRARPPQPARLDLPRDRTRCRAGGRGRERRVSRTCRRPRLHSGGDLPRLDVRMDVVSDRRADRVRAPALPDGCATARPSLENRELGARGGTRGCDAPLHALSGTARRRHVEASRQPDRCRGGRSLPQRQPGGRDRERDAPLPDERGGDLRPLAVLALARRRAAADEVDGRSGCLPRPRSDRSRPCGDQGHGRCLLLGSGDSAPHRARDRDVQVPALRHRPAHQQDARLRSGDRAPRSCICRARAPRPSPVVVGRRRRQPRDRGFDARRGGAVPSRAAEYPALRRPALLSPPLRRTAHARSIRRPAA